MAHPLTPTSTLPPLILLPTYSTIQIREALGRLRDLYFPLPTRRSFNRTDSSNAVPTLKQQISGAVRVLKPKSTGRLVHDDGVPDSGYASAEEDETEEDIDQGTHIGSKEKELESLEILRCDELERDFAIRWLTGFIKRSYSWASELNEEFTRECVIDNATKLLARFAGDDEPEEALTRQFSFPFRVDTAATSHVPITVELNDAPLAPTDHTAVGLQSWASAILLAERMCAEPKPFFHRTHGTQAMRVLELGAGTGLLSIVTSKILSRLGIDASVIATDYHPSVLSNLSLNVATNNVPVAVSSLDWAHPPLHDPFDIVLAADVIYHPEHARWIKECVAGLLKADGVFWLVIPLRSTGRHEKMSEMVDEVFQSASLLPVGSANSAGEHSDGGKRCLVVVRKEEVGRLDGVGRADEAGYKLFEIRWVGDNE
ncbi:S-adenosyl-L-methionine-dependent methyltransferase [Hygrophoropsis aurantiaca]|uniref:S-adenosyl-L-methionine-dependent methyltransferase n=1 Tax=Hygrophoropsis aurantiaca TaxID=72124 RepID=A0ACB8AA91_9AGAM|nr:S-adenosyl-L-methionine-dependent methyltransferase [Hygrophoropsis aurantiaca]